MLSAHQAQLAIQTHAPEFTPKSVALRDLAGCVLAETIAMERDQPPFNRVTMDGIAVNSRANTRAFRSIGIQAAGSPPLTLTSAEDCIEVMTGAELPAGCDCVIPIEHTTRNKPYLQLLDKVVLTAGLNIHPQGSDARQGQPILQSGTRLSATEIAILASAGHPHVRVRQSPRIALVSTGNELVEPGQPIERWQVRRSNIYAIHSALQQHQHHFIVDRHVKDDRTEMRHALDQLLQEHEVLIICGGVSMGQFDFVPQILTELGIQCIFHQVAQRPGKPMWFGVRHDGKTVYALPGNPVSSLVCLHRYVLPGLLHSMGQRPDEPEWISLTDSVLSHSELTVFLPVHLSQHHGHIQAEPRPTRGSGDFISLLGTDGFVELTPTSGGIEAGTEVPLYRWAK